MVGEKLRMRVCLNIWKNRMNCMHKSGENIRQRSRSLERRIS
jgi:hypothetical protein